MTDLGTLYEKYITERQDGQIIKNDSGFIAFRIQGSECFVLETYVEKEKRRTGSFKSLFEKLKVIAASKSCHYISGEIHIKDKNRSTTLLCMLSIGAEPVLAEIGIIKLAYCLEV
jgi:hypothetical protein